MPRKETVPLPRPANQTPRLTAFRRPFFFDARDPPPYIKVTNSDGLCAFAGGCMTTIDEIIDNFALLEEWDDRYRYLIELGRTLDAAAGRRPQRRQQGAGLRQPSLAFDAGEAERHRRPGAAFHRRQRRPHRARADRGAVRALFRQAGARHPVDRRDRAVREAGAARAPHAAALQRLPLHGQPHPARRAGGAGDSLLSTCPASYCSTTNAASSASHVRTLPPDFPRA